MQILLDVLQTVSSDAADTEDGDDIASETVTSRSDAVIAGLDQQWNFLCSRDVLR